MINKNDIKPLYTEEQIQDAIAKLGEKLNKEYGGEELYLICVLKGSIMFTVDLSNPKEPKIIGELKITGFSDYLHFWSKDKLLGIGYETDEKTGEFLGVKLTMFDISDPSKVTAEATTVIKNADSSPATDDYKTVLIDKKKNLIAFTTESYDEYTQSYRVYSYKDGKFTKQLTYGLEDRWSYDYRSLYAGNVLYLVNTEKAIAFDMKNQFEKLGGIEF